jgi:hypothetical protein
VDRMDAYRSPKLERNSEHRFQVSNGDCCRFKVPVSGYVLSAILTYDDGMMIFNTPDVL